MAPQAAAITLPWLSPWRVLIIGSTLGPIVESTLVSDLAQPQAFGDVSWIKPGRVSWSWWSDMASPRDYRKVFPFVDLASRLRWEYSLLDAGWHADGERRQRERAGRVRAGTGVGLIAWYNSGGAHNQAKDGPRDLMVDPETRRAEMRRIAALGFKGIKVDFMHSDKQYVIALYQDILRDAYANRLVVDFHGATIPRGWQRTFPNLLTMEAVLGAEQYGDTALPANAATVQHDLSVHAERDRIDGLHADDLRQRAAAAPAPDDQPARARAVGGVRERAAALRVDAGDDRRAARVRAPVPDGRCRRRGTRPGSWTATPGSSRCSRDAAGRTGTSARSRRTRWCRWRRSRCASSARGRTTCR